MSLLKKVVVLFVILVILFLPINNLFAYYDKDIPGTNLSGGIAPNRVGDQGIVAVGLSSLLPEEYRDINKINVTVEYHAYDNVDNRYIYLANPSSLNNIYLSFYKRNLFAGEPLVEGIDYTVEKGDCIIGEVRCVSERFDLFKKDKLSGDGYLEFYFESFKLLKKGNIKVTVKLYKSPDDSVPIKQGYVELPILEGSIITISPSLTPIVTSIPSPSLTPNQGITISPIPSPNISPDINKKLEELKKQLSVVENKQENMNREIKKQQTILDQILSFIKNLFQKISPFR